MQILLPYQGELWMLAGFRVEFIDLPSRFPHSLSVRRASWIFWNNPGLNFKFEHGILSDITVFSYFPVKLRRCPLYLCFVLPLSFRTLFTLRVDVIPFRTG